MQNLNATDAFLNFGDTCVWTSFLASVFDFIVVQTVMISGLVILEFLHFLGTESFAFGVFNCTLSSVTPSVVSHFEFVCFFSGR